MPVVFRLGDDMKLTTALLLALSLGLVHSTASANLLANPGFEDPITVDGPPFVGIWQAFSFDGDQTTGGDVARNSTLMPRTGSQSLEVGIFGVNNSFAGVFQDVAGLVAGQTVSYDGWHKRGGTASDIEFRIEWRDSVSNTEVSRTPNSTPTPGNTYESFSLGSVVPAGADTARVVYSIQSFGGVTDQQVFVDDVSFTADAIVTPAPATLGLLGLGGAMLFLRRRRRIS